jgi:hypothetical protein
MVVADSGMAARGSFVMADVIEIHNGGDIEVRSKSR